MNKLLAIIAISTVLIGGFLVMRDPGHVPLFDADLNRLAETEAEGFCAGMAFWDSQGEGSATQTKDCRSTSAQATEFNLPVVQYAFCLGAVSAGFTGDPTVDCLSVLQQFQYWPTYDGALTDAWTKANPYPGDVWAPPAGSGSRTGGRETAPREEIAR